MRRPPTYLEANWVRSDFCTASSCVEIARLASGDVAIRDSKDLRQRPLKFTDDEFRAFIAGARSGQFDHL